MHLRANCSLWLSEELHPSIFPAGEAKFDSDCVAKRQNSSNADGIDLIKCWGKYNSWNSRKTNRTKCKICGKFKAGVGADLHGGRSAAQGDE